MENTSHHQDLQKANKYHGQKLSPRPIVDHSVGGFGHISVPGLNRSNKVLRLPGSHEVHMYLAHVIINTGVSHIELVIG